MLKAPELTFFAGLGRRSRATPVSVRSAVSKLVIA